MADYPSTGTLFDGSPPPETGGRTRAGLSTQIIVYVNNEPVGAIQSFQESQTRSLKQLSEVGTDGLIEIVPQSSATFSLTINRIVFDGLSLPEAFSRGFRNIQSQRMPFDIVVIDKFTGDGNSAVVTTYHNCWFAALGKSYTTTDYTITENATVNCEHVSTTRAGEAIALSQGTQGAREIPGRNIDSVETAADSGERRGTLDFPGLISAAY
jgi:hypothetical protein